MDATGKSSTALWGLQGDLIGRESAEVQGGRREGKEGVPRAPVTAEGNPSDRGHPC